MVFMATASRWMSLSRSVSLSLFSVNILKAKSHGRNSKLKLVVSSLAIEMIHKSFNGGTFDTDIFEWETRDFVYWTISGTYKGKQIVFNGVEFIWAQGWYEWLRVTYVYRGPCLIRWFWSFDRINRGVQLPYILPSPIAVTEEQKFWPD